MNKGFATRFLPRVGRESARLSFPRLLLRAGTDTTMVDSTREMAERGLDQIECHLRSNPGHNFDGLNLQKLTDLYHIPSLPTQE